MLKIKSRPGQPIVLDCSDYPEPSENQWATFMWLMERNVLSDAMEKCGWDGLTTVLNNNTVKEQSQFLAMIPMKDQLNIQLLRVCSRP